jgi:LuxR family maltose regulon positive regulatory protein
VAFRACQDPGAVRRALSGEGHLLTEYFREEVLDGLDDGDRDFLLRTSVLERPSGEMCDAVLGVQGSADRLAHLAAAAHTFVLPLRDSGVYRYHALFREMLACGALHRFPDEVDRVRRRAVAWHRDHGEGRAAVDQALATADPALAADAMYAELAEVIHRGELATLERWLARFPDRPGHRDDIRLALCEGWLALMLGRRGDVQRWLAIAESHVGDDGPMPDGSTSRTVAVAALRMIASIGGSREVLDCARLIRDAGPDGSPYWAVAGVIAGVQEHVLGLAPDIRDAMAGPEFDARGMAAPHVVALGHLSFGAYRRGDSAEGDRLLREACEEVDRHALNDYPMVSIVHCVRAYAEALHGGADRSADAARHAEGLLATLIEVTDRGQIHLRLLLAEAALLRGDTVAAEAQLGMAEDRLFREPDAVVLHQWVDDLRARVERRRRRPPVAELTPAEQRVLDQLPTHRSLAEIGEHLYVSRNTVKSHTLSVYRKLGVAGRSQAVEQARLLGLLDRPARDLG